MKLSEYLNIFIKKYRFLRIKAEKNEISMVGPLVGNFGQENK